jgi:uncharacterized protein
LEPEFHPIFSNPHLLTIAGNFWPRKIDEIKFPSIPRQYKVDARNTILALEHRPSGPPAGEIVLLHGLEGSAAAGYFASLTQSALERNFGVHRLNMRTCGGTESMCETMYHSGLTSDPRRVLEEISERNSGPLYLVGFSLGGNVALKLAGELGKSELLAGVCSVSAPIDLARSVREIGKLSNRIYARRFLSRLRSRVQRKSAQSPDLYSCDGLSAVKTIWEFDDRFTAPLFGFGTAARYYQTQSSVNFLSKIHIPTLLITAQDDPLVPFEIYKSPIIAANPALTLLSPKHGGHLGFLSRRRPRFWLDEVILNWLETNQSHQVQARQRVS